MKKIRLIVILDCILAVVLFGFILQQYGSDSVIETAKRSSMKDYEKKYVALTFDDGPNPDYTEILLEGLKERGIKATFFLLGEEVEKYPEIVEKIHRDGHLIGVHSYKHVNLSELSDEAARLDVLREVCQTIAQDMPVVPLLYAGPGVACSSRVNSLAVSADYTLDFAGCWLSA